MEVLGHPDQDLLGRSTRKKLFYNSDNEPKIVANSRGKKRYPDTKNIREILRGADIKFVELVLMCFEWDPNKRITPKLALNHPWITEERPVTRSDGAPRISLHKGQTINSSLKLNLGDSITQNPNFQAKQSTRKIGITSSYVND